jgi:hypothetical protein
MEKRHRVTHTDKLGRVAEDLAIIKLSTLFPDCYVSQVVNGQLHDLEIRKKDEKLTRGICKIHVKATNSRGTSQGGVPFYHISIQHGHGKEQRLTGGKKIPYREGDNDFFLFYIFPEAKFYVVPSDVIKDRVGAKFYVGLTTPTRRDGGICEKYLEAWSLIAEFLGIATPIEEPPKTKLIDTTLIIPVIT